MNRTLLKTQAHTGPNTIEVEEMPGGRFRIVLSQDGPEGAGTIVIQQGAYGPSLFFRDEEGQDRAFAMVDLFYNSLHGRPSPDSHSDHAWKGPLNLQLYNPLQPDGDTPAFVRYLTTDPEKGPLFIDTEYGMMEYAREYGGLGWAHNLRLEESYRR